MRPRRCEGRLRLWVSSPSLEGAADAGGGGGEGGTHSWAAASPKGLAKGGCGPRVGGDMRWRFRGMGMGIWGGRESGGAEE